MSLLQKRSFYYTLAALLAFFFFVLPFILGMAFRGTVEAKVKEAVGAPVKLGSLAVHLFPCGATLSNLEVGAPDAAAANQPLVKVGSLRANVSLGTVFGGNLRVTRLSLIDAELNVAVNEKGDSSFSRFIREMPQSDRKVALPIDSLTLKNARINSYLSRKLSGVKLPDNTPDGTTDVGKLSVGNLVLPPPGELLGREEWIDVDISDIVLKAPPLEGAGETPSGAVADGASIDSISLQLAQAANTETPVKIRRMDIDDPEIANVYTKPGQKPALARSLEALQMAMGEKESAATHKSGRKPEAPQGTGMLIEDFHLAGGRIETRGPDAAGQPAYWRMKNLSIDANNLAVGPKVKAAEPGELKVVSETESSSGPGNFSFVIAKIEGGYPRWTSEIDYKLERAAAPAFEGAANSGFKKGAIDMQLAGPSKKGKLELSGSLTLSEDFEMTGGLANSAAKLAKGKPFKPVKIGGTFDNPKIDWPSAIGGALGDALNNVAIGDAGGVLDSVDSLVGTTVGTSFKEATQAVDTIRGIKDIKNPADLIDKIPGVKKLFGSESDE